MNRKEEIRRAADEWGAKTEAECIRYPEFLNVMSGNKIGFCDGALWADSHQWISVKERLPEKGEIVIIHCKTYGIISALFDDRWEGEEGTDLYYTGDMALEQDDIDWWMPIPPLPKKGGKE